MKTFSTLPGLMLALTLFGNGAYAAPAALAEAQKPAIRDCCGGAGGYEPPAGLNGWQPARRQALPLGVRSAGGGQDPPTGLNGWQPARGATLPLSSDARIGGDVPPAGTNGWQPAQRNTLPLSAAR